MIFRLLYKNNTWANGCDRRQITRNVNSYISVMAEKKSTELGNTVSKTFQGKSQ